MTSDPLDLNIHLMHPGGPSAPGDPNVAFHIDGVYHLHYIIIMCLLVSIITISITNYLLLTTYH